MNFKQYYSEDQQHQYTVNDIDYKENKIDIRHYDKDSNIEYKKEKVIDFFTKDGKYYTKSDSAGYSYWYRKEPDSYVDTMMGRGSYDYIYGTLILNNLQHVVDVLNKVIK